MITATQLKAIMPYAKAKAIDTFLPHFNTFMPAYDITGRLRMAAFLAQLAHESGSLQYVREIASGNAYEGREDLGNIHPGDGVRFKGRGLIQLTGRRNYDLLSIAFFGDDTLVKNPELLTTPTNAVRSACWFWDSHHLNELADEGKFETITRRINGGLNGYAERKAFYARALKALTPQKTTSKTK